MSLKQRRNWVIGEGIKWRRRAWQVWAVDTTDNCWITLAPPVLDTTAMVLIPEDVLRKEGRPMNRAIMEVARRTFANDDEREAFEQFARAKRQDIAEQLRALQVDWLTVHDDGVLLQSSNAARVIAWCERVIDGWSLLLPQRVANEELGDYLEKITALAQSGRFRAAYLRTVTAIIYTGLSAAHYVLTNNDAKSRAR